MSKDRETIGRGIEVNASLNIPNGTIRSEPPNSCDGFINISEAMLSGAQILASSEKPEAVVVTHLCGHSIETSLKAILSRQGVSIDDLKNSKLYGHSLSKLWARAFPGEVIPEWLNLLNRLHAAPYTVRYPLDFNGLVLPNQNDLVGGALSILARAKTA